MYTQARINSIFFTHIIHNASTCVDVPNHQHHHPLLNHTMPSVLYPLGTKWGESPIGLPVMAPLSLWACYSDHDMCLHNITKFDLYLSAPFLLKFDGEPGAYCGI